jgi:hypothetical protein
LSERRTDRVCNAIERGAAAPQFKTSLQRKSALQDESLV